VIAYREESRRTDVSRVICLLTGPKLFEKEQRCIELKNRDKL